MDNSDIDEIIYQGKIPEWLQDEVDEVAFRSPYVKYEPDFIDRLIEKFRRRIMDVADREMRVVKMGGIPIGEVRVTTFTNGHIIVDMFTPADGQRNLRLALKMEGEGRG